MISSYKLAYLKIIIISILSRLVSLAESRFSNRFFSLAIAQFFLIAYILGTAWPTFDFSLKLRLKRKTVMLVFLLILAQGIKFAARSYRIAVGKPLYESGLLQTLYFALLPLYKVSFEALPLKAANHLHVVASYHALVTILYVLYEGQFGYKTGLTIGFEIVELILEHFEYEFTYELYFSEMYFFSEYFFYSLYALLGTYYEGNYKIGRSDLYYLIAYVCCEMIVVYLSNFELDTKFVRYKELKLLIFDAHFESFLNPVVKLFDVYCKLNGYCKYLSRTNMHSGLDVRSLANEIHNLAAYLIITMLYVTNFIMQSVFTYLSAT